MASFFIPPAVITFSLSSYFRSCNCGNLKVFCQLRFDLTAGSQSHNNLANESKKCYSYFKRDFLLFAKLLDFSSPGSPEYEI